MIQSLLVPGDQREHDCVLVREILVEGSNAHAGCRCDHVRVESPKSVGFQNASSRFKDDAHRFLRPRLTGQFAGIQRALAGPASAVSNTSFIYEHLLVLYKAESQDARKTIPIDN